MAGAPADFPSRLNAVVAAFALNERAPADRPERAVAYLSHVTATGGRCRITALLEDLSSSDEMSTDRCGAASTAVLSGSLG